MNMIEDVDPQEFEIKDKLDGTLTFTGWRIGHASTRQSGSARWTELSIYRTEGGKYIVQTEGVSLVYHRNDGRCRPLLHLWDVVENSQINDDGIPCPVCRPPSVAQLNEIEDTDTSTYRIEATESNAEVVEHGSMIPRALTYRGKLVSGVATDVIRSAIQNDPSLAALLQQTRRIA